MNTHITKRLREGNLLAEVQVRRFRDEMPWEPSLSPEDARKLERVRAALNKGDTVKAAKDAKVFEVKSLAAE
jgi:hypothetical protein